jgi:hypothetical protein
MKVGRGAAAGRNSAAAASAEESPMPPQNRPPPRPLPPGQRFKPQIEKALANGFDSASLVLQLTFTDAAKLKRDPNISLEDLSFRGGEMRYLGVKVVEGGADASSLVILNA